MLSPETEYYPLTHGQKGLWYTEQFYPGTAIGSIIASIRLRGDIDNDKLGKAINIFIEKNAGMRIRIVEVDGEPKQYVAEHWDHEWEILDFSDKGLKGFYTYVDDQIDIPFKLINSELFFYSLYKIGEQEGGIFVKTHHLISDAWTMTLMASEIVEYYTKLQMKEEITDNQYPSYIDFIKSEGIFESSLSYKSNMQFWSTMFENVPELATLKPRIAHSTSTKARRKEFIINQDLTNKINKYSDDYRYSGFILFLSALSIYLYRVIGKEDIIIGVPILLRPTLKEQTTTGMFIDTIPIRLNVDANLNFQEYLSAVSQEWKQAMKHRYPHDLLLQDVREKHNTKEILYDIVLSFQKAQFKIKQEYETRWFFNRNQTESLRINISDRENTGNLIIEMDYLLELFTEKEIESIQNHMLTVLKDAIENPEKKLFELEILTEEEKYQLLYKFNDTYSDYPRNKTIHQLFEEQVERTPDNIAVVFKEKKLTYIELNQKSNQLARLLREKGVGADVIVAIMVNRSLEMIIGILAILKAGGAYLPIDPDYPLERIEFMLNDSRANLLFTQKHITESVRFTGEVLLIDNVDLYSGNGSNLTNLNKPIDLAYVIYTSGSTGKPKGVMVEHFSVINRINWMQKKYPIGEDDTILQKTPFTFDVSVWELFWWGFTGARVNMLPPGGEKDSAVIVDAVHQQKITTMHFVPSMLRIFLDYLEDNPSLLKQSFLRRIFASGEVLTSNHVQRFNRILSQRGIVSLHNLYGPTEATVDVSYYDCPIDSSMIAVIPIGKPIDNIKLYILDSSMQLLPIGAVGELYISGDGIARGYLNRPELTVDKFISNPFIHGTRMYRTGDMARWLSTGQIEYLGRIDHQVKIRGNRIELGEVESQLLNHDKINQTVVIDRSDIDDTKYLCAYYIANHEISNTELRSHLGKTLPDYMIPSSFIRLENLPLSSNGKIDRKALPEPTGRINTGTEYVPPRNVIEKSLVEIWSELLGVDNIGVKDNFFALGGHSLKATSLAIKIKKNFSLEFSPRQVYKTPTIVDTLQLEGTKNRTKAKRKVYQRGGILFLACFRKREPARAPVKRKYELCTICTAATQSARLKTLEKGGSF